MEAVSDKNDGVIGRKEEMMGRDVAQRALFVLWRPAAVVYSLSLYRRGEGAAESSITEKTSGKHGQVRLTSPVCERQ